MPTDLPVFLVVTWLLAMSPGPGQALMVRQTLAGGRRLAWASTAGHATGLLVWSTAAAAGLSAILLANPTGYLAVRVVGGLVLFGLGAHTLLGLRRPGAARSAAGPGGPTGFWGGYTVGLTANLGNLKAGAFAISVLPQFVTATGPVLLSSVALGVIWALVTVCWYLFFTWALDRGRALLTRPAVDRGLRLATGGVLLVLGVSVAAGL